MSTDTITIKKADFHILVGSLIKVSNGETLNDDERFKLNQLYALGTTESNVPKPSIGAVLKQLGVRPGILGYDYLKTAVDLCLEDRSLIQNITKGLYPAIAKIHDTTSSRAERAMRHAVEVAFDNYGDDTLRDAIFGNSTDPNKGKPTNTHFIAAVVEYFSEE